MFFFFELLFCVVHILHLVWNWTRKKKLGRTWNKNIPNIRRSSWVQSGPKMCPLCTQLVRPLRDKHKLYAIKFRGQISSCDHVGLNISYYHSFSIKLTVLRFDAYCTKFTVKQNTKNFPILRTLCPIIVYFK